MPDAGHRQVVIRGKSGLIGGTFFHRSLAFNNNDMAPIRVLVVDDYPDSAESVAQWLALDGFEAKTARDGAQALELAKLWRPDVCVVDLQMPKVDGFEVARTLRVEPWAEQVLLIAHSGHATREVRERACEAGFDSYFAKPAEPQEFLRVIYDQAAKRRITADAGEYAIGHVPAACNP